MGPEFLTQNFLNFWVGVKSNSRTQILQKVVPSVICIILQYSYMKVVFFSENTES